MGNEGQVQRPWWQQPAWWLLGGVTVFNLAYLFLTPFDLFPDEAQYWDWSRHLQWSYYSKGPLIAWLIALFTRFTGPTPWGVRLGAVLLTAVVAFFVSRLVLLESRSPASGQSQPALLTTFSLLLLNPLFSVGQVLMTTDVPFIACWTAALYALARVLQEEGADWWIIGAGVALGLGFLAKYSMLLLLLPLLFTLVQERRLTLWLRRPSTYGAALVALLLAAPVLIWNAQHDWPTVRHVARLAGQGRGWRFFVPEFLTAQILLLTPFVFLYLTRVSLRAVRAEASAAEKLLGWSFLALFGFFLLKAAQSKVEQNWPAMAYVGAMVLAGRAWARGEGTRPGRRRWAVVSLVLMVGLSLLARSFPLLHHLFPSERLVRIDPTRRGVGYRELGQAVGAWRERLARQTG
ncbi:MAG TPA: phospholipid carrier-dependent glycosyltransferase, partial [Armatimonadetes bacterium]|nr:phospholipid carrier-dependent glycosyltransferase [Armatimonadota bacterium]